MISTLTLISLILSLSLNLELVTSKPQISSCPHPHSTVVTGQVGPRFVYMRVFMLE